MASWMYNFPYFTFRPSVGTAPTRNTLTLDASGSSWRWQFQAEEDATITHVAYLQTAFTGTPGTITLGLKSVDANGGVGSTYLASGTKTSYSSGDNETYVQIALSSSYAVTRGQSLAVELQTSGTWTSSSVTFVNRWTNLSGSGPGYPLLHSYEGWPIFMYRSSTKAYGSAFINLTAVGPWTPNSTPDEVGLSFKLPAQTGNFKIQGAEIYVGATNTDNKFDLVLYKVNTAYSSITELQRANFDLDWTRIQQHQFVIAMFDESTLSTLDYDQEYILSMVSTGSVSQNAYYNYATVDDTYLSAHSPGTLKYVSRSDSGTFTTTANRLLCLNALIGSTSGGSGGGGLLVHPGMTGRISG